MIASGDGLCRADLSHYKIAEQLDIEHIIASPLVCLILRYKIPL